MKILNLPLDFKAIFGILALSLTLIQCQSRPVSTASPVVRAGLPLSSEIRADHSTAEATGPNFAVSTQGKFSTEAAQQIYTAGGNIIDATVAASFAVAVERPQSTGIGGGGFLIFRQGQTGKVFAVDFRERAPAKAFEAMYVGPDGKPDKSKSRNGVLAAGVPGLIAGLIEIHQKFGKLPLAQVMAPAIRLAEEGFPVYLTLAKALEARQTVLASDPAARAIFLDANGKPWPVGHTLIQKDLAKTLKLIAGQGRSVFYRGTLAGQMAAFFKDRKGLITSDDLARYQVKWREPLRSKYQGLEIVAMPPPSSGGVHVIQFLNMLEKEQLKEKGALSPTAIHLAASALQSAFVDRSKYLGDPDFVKVPVSGLIAKKYAQQRRLEIPADRARKADELAPGNPFRYESAETTHLSLMDSQGNAVSTTQTVNGWMGAGVVIPGTGIMLNNEMDDFSAQEGSSNMFGAVGGKANGIAAHKTPLSSMSPTILLRNGEPWMTVGAPGGTRIISCVAQTILNVVEFQMPLFEAVAAVRYHHQWRPDVLVMDPPGPGVATLEQLKTMGYQVELQPVGCYVMAVLKEENQFHAVADPRDIGTSAAQ